MHNKTQQTIVLASGNQGKITEIQALLRDYTIVAQNAFNVSQVAETGTTFIENALIKARHACEQTQLPAIADDSGLIVAALNGAPGIISARYSGLNATDKENNQKLLTELQAYPDEKRAAYFICVMVFLRHQKDSCPLIAQGVWQGFITKQPQGVHGFGYDSLFWLPQLNCTAAQLSATLKNQYSHRGQATRQLAKLITAHY